MPKDDELDKLMDENLIGALCKLVREAGLTMTLHGVPVTEDELRAHAEKSAIARLADAVINSKSNEK